MATPLSQSPCSTSTCSVRCPIGRLPVGDSLDMDRKSVGDRDPHLHPAITRARAVLFDFDFTLADWEVFGRYPGRGVLGGVGEIVGGGVVRGGS